VPADAAVYLLGTKVDYVDDLNGVGVQDRESERRVFRA
jgi:Fe-S cluster assembly iron-binding protein IscA